MNRRGELSNKKALTVAINYDTIFKKSRGILSFFKKRNFKKEFKDITYKLFHKGFNVYIIVYKSDVENEEIWGKYVFFNEIRYYDNFQDLSDDCKYLFDYYIDDNRNMLLENSYSLEEFKELL